MLPVEILAQSAKITNWFTPVWLLALGVSIGFILVLLLVLKIFVVSKIPFFNSVADKPGLRTTLGVILGAIYIGLFVAFYAWQYGKGGIDEGIVLPLIFVVPVSLLIGWGVWGLCSRRRAAESLSMMQEGFLSWLNWVCISLVAFAVVALGLSMTGVFKFVETPDSLLKSLTRLPYAGTYSMEYPVEPNDDSVAGTKFPTTQIGFEVKQVRIVSNQRIEMACEPITKTTPPYKLFEVAASNDERTFLQRDDGMWPVPKDQFDDVYIRNLGNNTANVKVDWVVEPVNSEVSIVPWAAFSVLMVYLLYLVFSAVFPKVSAIALSTYKTEISQSLFLLLLVIGSLFVVASIYIPYNTFGEDIKMYKDSGLTMIKVLAIFMAIWAASKSVAEEIEGRTALTVLSKPVGRRQFIVGKFCGISLAIGMLFILLGLWFVFWTSYKMVYDTAELGKGVPEWMDCYAECTRIIPALFLAFLEVTIFVAISVAISTRLSILANFLICFSIYVLGHLTPLIVQSSDVVQAFEPVVLFGQVISIIFPVLDHFDVQAAINTSRDVPLTYLGWSIIYCALYGTMAMLLGLVFFEDRDLA